MRQFARSIVVLLIAAVVLHGIARYLLAGLETVAAEYPVDLLESREYSRDFDARWDVNYEIRLEGDRNLDLQRHNCLLGIETVAPDRCAGTAAQLLLSWHVETSGTVLASGSSNDADRGYWGLNIGKVLGSFPASRGTSYRVWIKIIGSSPTLQQTNPRVKIEIAAEDLKWTYVWVGILNQAAAFCGLLALILLTLSTIRSASARL